METSAISYRVADFLKKHPPFQAMEDSDLLALAAHGRVRFHEAHEYILWQGEPHKSHVFVIQQGTVSLWDEEGGRSVLLDVRGAGDLLGIERYTGAPCCLHSARSASDVVIYSFPASDFEELVLKYPYARQFVAAHDEVTADFHWAKDARDLQTIFLPEVVGRKPLESCSPESTIRDVAGSLLASGSDAMAVVDENGRLQSVVTVDSILAWVAAGAGNAGQPVSSVPGSPLSLVGPEASVVDGVLAIAGSDASALALTSDGTVLGQLQAVVTPKDLARAFGDQPIAILQEIRRATSPAILRELNRRTRAFALQHLTTSASLDWVARVVSLADVEIVRRLIALSGVNEASACWCFCGASGRGESLTRHAPQLVLIVEDEHGREALRPSYDRVFDAFVECDYLARVDMTFDRAFHVATLAEWVTRYERWLRDPVRSEMYLARPLFDLRPVHGDDRLWQQVASSVAAAIDGDFLQILANDCLASLPPLTFFQDAVVEKSGEQTAIFRLEESALRPLVDVGRVFGMAARQVLGTSTMERFGHARTLLPEHDLIFREAAETLRILLWQQARIGIDQNTSGSELPPAALSRHDRHVLKSGFRSILRLVELTGHPSWVVAS